MLGTFGLLQRRGFRDTIGAVQSPQTRSNPVKARAFFGPAPAHRWCAHHCVLATSSDIRVRFHIICIARTKNVGKYQSCMVYNLRIIWKRTRIIADVLKLEATARGIDLDIEA